MYQSMWSIEMNNYIRFVVLAADNKSQNEEEFFFMIQTCSYSSCIDHLEEYNELADPTVKRLESSPLRKANAQWMNRDNERFHVKVLPSLLLLLLSLTYPFLVMLCAAEMEDQNNWWVG